MLPEEFSRYLMQRNIELEDFVKQVALWNWTVIETDYTPEEIIEQSIYWAREAARDLLNKKD